MVRTTGNGSGHFGRLTQRKSATFTRWTPSLDPVGAPHGANVGAELWAAALHSGPDGLTVIGGSLGALLGCDVSHGNHRGADYSQTTTRELSHPFGRSRGVS